MDFRLAYNNGDEFVDLFPSTSLDAIQESENLLKYTTIDVNIPAMSTQENTQTISITTTDKQVDAPVSMMLLDSGSAARQSYSTITQFQVTANTLTITRLYSFPSTSINVRLIFEEAGV